MVAINKLATSIIKYPANDLQNQMINHCLQSDIDGLYLIQVQIALNEVVSHRLLARAWHRALAKHQILRSNIDFDKQTYQHYYNIQSKINFHLHKTDLTDLPISDREKTFYTLKNKFLQKNFHFSHAPLFSLDLIKLAEKKYYFFWTIHHTLLDGDSIVKIISDAFNIYDASKVGKIFVLPEYRHDDLYEDYISHINEKAAKNFWHSILAGYKSQVFEKSLIKPLTIQQKYLSTTLSHQLTNDIQAKCKSSSLTPATYFMAVWSLLLALYKNSDDILLGVVRSLPQKIKDKQEGNVYLNTLPTRIKLTANMTAQELLINIRKQQIEQKEFLNTPYRLITEELSLAANQQLFDNLFDFKNLHPHYVLKSHSLGWTGRKMSYVTKTDYPLCLEAYMLENQFGIRISYRTDYFTDTEAKRLLSFYKNFLTEILNNESKPLKNISCLTEKELIDFLADSNGNKNEKFLNKTLTSALIPTNNKVALKDESVEINYYLLNLYSNRLANIIHAQPLKANSIIAIYAETSVWQIIFMLGIIKSGHAYLPIDIDAPIDRIQFELEDSACFLILCTDETIKQFSDNNKHANNFNLINAETSIQVPVKQHVLPAIKPSDLAYIIYTSGTTGKPKGVLIRHENIVNLCLWHKEYYQVNKNSRLSQMANISFDAASWSIWAALLNGASLYICSDNIKKDPIALIDWHQKYAITHSFIPTPMAENLLKNNIPRDFTLKYLLVGGDRLHTIPKTIYPFTIYNNYGPTETTVVATATPVKPGTIKPYVGTPITNTTAIVLNKILQTVPNNIAGELYISGAGIGNGYLNQVALTNEKFIHLDHFNKEIWFKTGDIVKRHAYGQLEYINRIDQQVKISGYRIELAEIENTIRAFKGIKDAIVLLDKKVSPVLIAFYLVQEHSIFNENSLKKYLAEKLPYYMLPNRFVLLNQIPVTNNGKINQRDLFLMLENKNNPQVKLTIVQDELLNKFKHIWSIFLNTSIKKISANSNYFELGGDSITCYRIIAEAKNQGIHFSVKQLYENPVLIDLINQILASKDKPVTEKNEIFIGNITLTPIQHWFLSTYTVQPNLFSHICRILLAQNIDNNILIQAIKSVIAKHDNFHIQFSYDKAHNEWRECYQNGKNDLKIHHYNLSQKASNSISKEKFIINHLLKSIHIERAPLAKAAIIQHGNQSSLIIIIHHLIIDTVSWAILINEIESAYKQLLEKKPNVENFNSLSYQKWSELLYKKFATSNKRAQKKRQHYLEKNLQYSLPAILKENLIKPFDSAAPLSKQVETGFIESKLSSINSINIMHFAINIKISQEAILLAAFYDALSMKQRNKDKLWLTVEHHGRDILQGDLSFANTLGWFTHKFPCLFVRAKHDSFATFCKKVDSLIKSATKEAVEYNVTQIVQPLISFNFLGDIYNQTSDIFKDINIELYTDPKFKRTTMLDVICYIKQQQLYVQFHYDKAFLSEEYLNSVIKKFFGILKNVNKLTTGTIDVIVEQDNFKQLYQLTSLQAGLYYQQQLKPYAGEYHIQTCLDFIGKVNINKLTKAIQTLLSQNQIFRTIFINDNQKKLMQQVFNDSVVVFKFHDWQALSSKKLKHKLMQFLQSDRNNPFKLSELPLIRFNLIKFKSNQHRLIISYHHIIMDGWSLQNMMKQLLSAYDGEKIKLPTDFNAYLSYLKNNATKAQKQYWKNRLLGFTKLTKLSIDKESNHDGVYEAKHAKYLYIVQNRQKKAIDTFAKQNNITVNTILLTAFTLLLQKYSGNQDLIFGITVSNRPLDLEDVEQIIGPMIQTLPFRVSLDNCINIIDLLKMIQKNLMLDIEYNQLPLHTFKKFTDLPNKLPLFELLYLFENYPKTITITKDFKIKNTSVIERTQYKLTLTIVSGSELNLDFTYDVNAFNENDIKIFCKHYLYILEQLLAKQNIPLKDISLLKKSDRKKLLYAWNNTIAALPKEAHLLKYFQAKAKKTPKQLAIVSKAASINYQELMDRSQQIAQLITPAMSPEIKTVGILLERNIDAIASMLAAMWLGLRYLPLDAKLPVDRLKYMIKDANANIIISNQKRKTVTDIFAADHALFELDKLHLTNEHLDDYYFHKGLMNKDAYLMYTSGSTGQPKGVIITHQNLINFLLGMNKILHFKNKDRFLAITTFNFDISGLELWLPLITGGTIVLADEETQFDAQKIQNLIQQYDINYIQATPITWNMLLKNRWLPKSNMHLLSGGEAMTRELASQLLITNAKLWNVYGPTETTIWSTLHKVDKHSLLDNIIAIGKPIQNTKTYVLDNYLHLVPINFAGELYIAGKGLARGYLNKPELTNEKFIPNPFEKQELMYKTGDLAKLDKEGSLHYLGRIDNQVKIHGFRIEIAEIELALKQHPGVNDCVVLANAQAQLLAYIIPANADTQKYPSTVELRNFLSNILPYYMIPSYFIFIDSFPLTHSKKIDKNILLTLANNTIIAKIHKAPTNQIEETLVKIFAEVLKLPSNTISIDDDFFELGGDSITAMQLLNAIKQAFNTKLDLNMLFKAETIRLLSEEITNNSYVLSVKDADISDTNTSDIDMQALVPLKRKSIYQNLFLIHPIGGTVFCYKPLANLVMNNFSIYAIQDPGIHTKNLMFNSLTELSQYYYHLIKQQQPKGPYYIMGASFGGNAAVEIGRLLLANNEQVNFVGLIDSWAFYPAKVNQDFAWFSKNLKRQHAEVNRYYGSDFELPQFIIELNWHRQQLLAKHVIIPAKLPITLFKSATVSPVLQPIADDFNQWDNYNLSAVKLLIIPGDHETILQRPNIDVLVKKLEKLLKSS